MNFKQLLHYGLLIFACLAASISQAETIKNTCSANKLVVFGDSLVAGYGLDPGMAYPEQLGKVLADKGYRVEVINAGLSGDTTSGGLERLEWSIGTSADAVILELGANDALRGIPVENTRSNLDRMISWLKAQNTKVLLVGMMAPPNMGSTYGDAFNQIYPDLAEKHQVGLYPFFLESVAAVPELNQPDGIHPTKEGISIIVEKTLSRVENLIKSVCETE